jgi:SAM-dependent methyltransferase
MEGDIPVFTSPPDNIQPSEKIERSPKTGTPWRQANWRFLQQQINQLGKESLILDVGAGRGDFSAVYEDRKHFNLDVYPYPEIHLVCDLTRIVPFRDQSFDAIVLMNVMEHIYDTRALFSGLSRLLKLGGVLIVAIPFMVKIHQAPIDYVRYTHYALQRIGEEHNLSTSLVEGYYDPVFFLGEGIGNLKWYVVPTLQGEKKYIVRILVAAIQGLRSFLDTLIGDGRTLSPVDSHSPAPIGYHILYKRV